MASACHFDVTLIVILILSKICPAEAVGDPEPAVVSVKVGEPVTLNCKSALTNKSKVVFWYKQRLEHKPKEVGYKANDKDQFALQELFKNSKSGFQLSKLMEAGTGVSLSIKQAQKEDEGIYFCGEADQSVVTFSTGTFLAVSDTANISVLQTPALQWVPPGEAVNLQCRVLSEIRSAELRVFWFRSAAGSSFPEIIYTHHNSSSRQCETSVYNFSKIITSENDAGTFYCAVASCGRIIVGNGTTVEINDYKSVLVGSLVLVLCLSFFCNIVQACWSWRRGICSGETSQSALHNLPEILHSQDDDDEEFDFAAVRFSDKMKRRVLKENVFTKVRFSPFTYDKLTQ